MKRKIFLSIIMLVILALVACNQKESASSDNDKEEKSDSNEAIEVVIGYSGPLSGPAAFYGENTLNGLTLAADVINEEGFEVNGQLYNIKVVSLDDQYLPNEAANNAKRLIQENDAKVIFNPHSGGIYAMQVFNEEDGFLIGAYTSEPGIIENGNTLTWRIPPGYDIYLEPFVKHQIDTHGKRIAFLPTASQYGKDWTEALRPVWEEAGGEVVYETEIDFAKDTDVQPIVTNALQNNPDVLFIGGASEPTALVVKAARDLGFEGGFMIMDQAKMDEMVAVLDGNWDLLEGTIGVLPLVNTDFPGTDAFIKLHNDKLGKDPGSEAGLHYVSLFALVEAMKIAGTVDDAKAIRDALPEAVQQIPAEHQVYTFEGVTKEGANESLLRIGVVENGEVKAVTLEDLGL
ncbi:ABC transporter substrate-binding protein [Pueribacillus sp. YX66]|uniref:ABC transporter substrate-binding protein n=1 Tax=Pueribacillus sp. YX66 TaxID=3229242 RepID=UPI00358D98E9